MNYGILSRNVIVKCLTLVMVMLFSYDVAAQKHTYNIGNNIKLYFGEFEPIANIISSKDDALIIADKITLWFDDNNKVYTFSSSYGNFVEFQEIHGSGSTKALYPRIWSPRKYHEEYYFVQNGSKLYLVKADIDYKTTDKGFFDGFAIDEKMIGIVPFDLSNIGDDFKIIMLVGTFRVDISILNNGVLYEYDDDDIIKYSSVSSPKADVDDSKTYSIDGMQVDTPHNGIFIKGNKKAFVK